MLAWQERGSISNSSLASLIRKHALITDIYLSDPNSSTGSHNNLFSYFVAPKRNVFYLPVYSHSSGRLSSQAIGNSLRISKTITRFIKSSNARSHQNCLVFCPLRGKPCLLSFLLDRSWAELPQHPSRNHWISISRTISEGISAFREVSVNGGPQ